jgi:hypothetical protein
VQGIIERTNDFRKSQELEPVGVDPSLEEAASAFASFMARTGKYGHTADGRRPSARAAAAGYARCIVAENIAYVYRSSGYDAPALAEQLVEGWKNSSEHRENMLNAAVTQTGVGIAQGESGRYFAVQMFGRPKSAALRFTVSNEAGTQVSYRAGKRSFSLGPRALRTHTVCRPMQIRIPLSGRAEPFTARVSDGVRYTVLEREGGLTVNVSAAP